MLCSIWKLKIKKLNSLKIYAKKGNKDTFSIQSLNFKDRDNICTKKHSLNSK